MKYFNKYKNRGKGGLLLDVNNYDYTVSVVLVYFYFLFLRYFKLI